MSPGLDELTTRAYELVSAGDLSRARAELEDGLTAAEFDGSTVPPDLAEAASLYARLLLAGGQPAEAREWAAYAHGAAERLYGAADERAVRDAATLAAALSRVGEPAAAEQLYREVVARLSARDGPGSQPALAARADLATVLHATGRCRAARSELAGALAAQQAGYGVDEPAGIRMLARLAAMSRDCGDEAAARRHFARATALATAYLPATHPVAGQVAALAAAPPDGAHPCAEAPDPAPAADWWPPEQDGDPDEPDPRAPMPGGAVPDGAVPTPYGTVPDGAVPDGAVPDGAVPDGAVPDGAVPDGAVPTPYGARVSRGHLAAPRRMPPAGHRPHPEPAHPLARSPAGTGADPAAGPVAVARVVGAPPAHPHQDDPYRDDPYRGQRLPAYRDLRDRARYERGRSRWTTLSVATGLAVLGIAGGWLAATSLIGDDEPAARRPPAANADPAPSAQAPTEPAPTRPAPTGLTVRDGRDSVTLTWTYPDGAEGPVLVTGGRDGEQQRAFQTLPAGTTTYTVHGLPERVDYCFTIAVVYSTDEVARSAPACTTRG